MHANRFHFANNHAFKAVQPVTQSSYVGQDRHRDFNGHPCFLLRLLSLRLDRRGQWQSTAQKSLIGN